MAVSDGGEKTMMKAVDAICSRMKDKSDETTLDNDNILPENMASEMSIKTMSKVCDDESGGKDLRTYKGDDLRVYQKADSKKDIFYRNSVNSSLKEDGSFCHDLNRRPGINNGREFTYNECSNKPDSYFRRDVEIDKRLLTMVRRPESPSVFGHEDAMSSEIAEMELSSKRNDLASSSTSSSNYDICSEPDTNMSKEPQRTNLNQKDYLTPNALDNCGRRKKRKNNAPRNICQLRDSSDGKDLSMYLENNKGVNFSKAMEPDSDNDEEQIFFEKQKQIMNNNNDFYKSYEIEYQRNGANQRHLDESGMDRNIGEDGVLDLSCSKHKSSGMDNSGSSNSSMYQIDDYGAMDLSSGKSSGYTFTNKQMTSSLNYQSKPGLLPSSSRICQSLNITNQSKYSQPTSRFSPYGRNILTLPNKQLEELPINRHSSSIEPVSNTNKTKISTVTDVSGAQPNHLSPEQAKKDASMMKEYAESTVNEFLNMFGLGEEDSQSFASSLPLQHLSSGNILNKWSSVKNGETEETPEKDLMPRFCTDDRLEFPFERSHTSIGESVAGTSEVSSPIAHRPVYENGSPISIEKVQALIKMAMLKKAKTKPEETSAMSNASLEGYSDQSSSPSRSVSPESVSLDSSVGTSAPPSKVGALFSPLKNASYPDYGKYVKRYTSFEKCGNSQCADLQYREHFHCVDCTYKVFLKKEEMIRHFKWHRKRDESLQHGFMRYSPMDDCGKKFDGCVHNGRQTHYHCLQPGCSKVYISTSDVQMHSNYHRKDSAIMQLGFQRFRATEDCGTLKCPFYGQRTTHFHCRKNGCHFTFKNKADIEKHKTYHQKDEILAKDGFKKFMKYETCQFLGCRFSKLANHIHCIRPGCDYVLHSTSQLLSHKRKHERREIEFAYRKFKEGTNQQAMLNPALAGFAAKSQESGLSQQFLPGEKANSEYSNQSDCSLRDPDSPRASDDEDDDFEVSRNVMSMSYNAVTGLRNMDNARFEPEKMGLLSRSMPDAAYSGHVLNLAANAKKNHEEPLKLTLPASTIAVNRYSSDDQRFAPEEPFEVDEEDEEDDDDDERMMMMTEGDRIVNDNGEDDNYMNPESPQTGVSPPEFTPKLSPMVNEKKERDESWKAYLTRFTANDPCHSRCQFLYKDHYHCNTKNCGMLYRSKDGVRDHAKQHEQLDRITALSYMSYDSESSCFDACPYNQKEKHYHCLWTECNQVISEKDPVFTRLDHYQRHEFSRSSRKVGNTPIMKTQQDLKRRRGRPPKYPKVDIPLVPKIEMSESDINAETVRLGLEHPIASGYKKFIAGQACPDDKCIYYIKEHFHCVRRRCHHATDNKDVLNLHAKEFHNYITIQEGFEFFDRTVNCRRPHCHNNKANRHFHCVRPKCDYSFVRYSTMNQHDKKHKMAEMGLTPHPTIGVPSVSIMNQPSSSVKQEPLSTSGSSQGQSIHTGTIFLGSEGNPVIIPVSNPLVIPKSAVDSKLIKPGGSHIVMNNMRPIAPKPDIRLGLPQMVIGISTSNLQSTQVISTASAINNISPIVIQPITTVINTFTNPVPSSLITSSAAMKQNVPTFITSNPGMKSSIPQLEAMPLAGLLKKGSSVATPQVNWESLLEKQHFSLRQNCNRPFCKLKKRDHYHCVHCNQAFSDSERLRIHVLKHGFKLDDSDNNNSQLPKLDGERYGGSIGKTSWAKTDFSDKEPSDDGDDDLDVSSSLTLNPLVFTDMLQKSQKQAMMNKSHYGYVDNEDDDDNEVKRINVSDKHTKLVMDLPPAVAALDQTKDGGVEESQLGNLPTFVSALNRQTNQTFPQKFDSYRSWIESNKEEPNIDVSEDDSDIEDDNNMTLSQDGGLPNSDIRRSSRKRSVTKHEDFVDSDDVVAYPKSRRLSTSSSIDNNHGNVMRSPDMKNGGKKFVGIYNKDHIPEGYEKFLNKTPCTMPHCTYKKNVTHYHCMRRGCNFGTTDRSRLLQHTERHRRTDEVLGDEFQQYRGTSECDLGSCEYGGKSTHYHCVKCQFICTDMSKVMAHRKHHNKIEAIEAQGFNKVTGGEDCGYDNCHHRSKQTHYHCVQGECMFVATGPQQMQFHNKSSHPIQM